MIKNIFAYVYQDYVQDSDPPISFFVAQNIMITFLSYNKCLRKDHEEEKPTK